MRLFIAIDVGKHIQSLLADIQNTLKKCNLAAKWVQPHNIHLTLKFLGEVEENKVANVKNVINTVTGNFSPFTIHLKEFGFFPTERNPRVFFVSTDNEERLKLIAYSLEETMEQLGFRREQRFRSHITLARLKSRKNIDCLIQKIKNIHPEGEIEVKEISLYKSTLTPHGPVYERLTSAPLKSI